MTLSSRFSRMALGVVSSLSVLAIVASCHSSDSVALAALAGGCSLDSDCTSPLICAFQSCHDQCRTSSDCNAPGLSGLCVESDHPFHVCLNTDESSCLRNSDCPGLEVCAVDQKCRDACVTSRDCTSGQSCSAGVCANPSELDGGALTSATKTSGSSCQYSTDCPATLVCLNGTCTVQCVTEKDCELGMVCQSSRCVPLGYTGPVPGGGDDAGPAGGDGGLGKSCAVDGECQDGVFCNGSETCVSGRCAPAASSACDDHSPCTADVCTESTQACVHNVIGGAAVDADGDHHVAIGCSGGDDCDDKDAANFPGNPEVCDFRDNNCNGLVDEQLWHQQTNTSTVSLPPPAAMGSYLPAGGGPLTAFPLPDGTYVVVSHEAFQYRIEDGPTEGMDGFFAWLVTSSFTASAGPVEVSQSASAEFDVDAPCGCVNATLKSPAIATDGAGNYAFGGEIDQSCDSACDNVPFKPHPAGGVTGPGLTTPATFTFPSTIDAQYSSGPSVPIWLSGLSKFAFVWRGEAPVDGGAATSFVQMATVTNHALDDAKLLFSTDVAAGLTSMNPSASSEASVRVAALANGATVLVGWTASTGHVRYALLDSSLRPLPSMPTPVELALAEDATLVDVLAVGSSYVLLTQDAMMQNARIRYVDARGVAGATAAIPSPQAGTTLHLSLQGDGFALIEPGPNGYRIGWAPASLALPENASVPADGGVDEGPFSFSDLSVSMGGGESRLVAIDKLHYVLFSGESNVSQISCGP